MKLVKKWDEVVIEGKRYKVSTPQGTNLHLGNMKHLVSYVEYAVEESNSSEYLFQRIKSFGFNNVSIELTKVIKD